MTALATDRDILAVPKVELHIHLNGSITEATASRLARRHGADPRTALELVDGRYAAHWPDFNGFLGSYLKANEFVRTPDDLEYVAAEFVRAQAAQRVSYSEAIFTAMLYVRNGMEPAAMWAALRRGLSAGGATFSPDAKQIVYRFADADQERYWLCTMRVDGTHKTRITELADSPQGTAWAPTS